MSAISFSKEKFSALPRPLPPEITTRAVPNSGRSDLVSSRLINSTFLFSTLKLNFSISALPPSVETGSKEVGRTVIIFLESLD